MTLLQTLIVVSEKAANVARLCRQEQHLFHLLVQQKSNDEANPRFIEDFKTLADVLVQEMVKHDVGKKFPEMRNYIHGEESNIFTNQLGESIIVEIQKSSEGTSDMLENVLAGDKRAANLLANEVHRSLSVEDVGTFLKPPEDECIDMNSINIWIDPIDSTSEYISGIEKQHDCGIYLNGLQCVTVLIGVYDRKTGNPIMGIINQPFCKNVNERWHGKCYWGVSTTNINSVSLPNLGPSTSSIICISSNEDIEIKNNLLNNGFTLVEAAGAGYKILTVILGLADAYVLSKSSTFRWDTCGPHAVLKSLGGDIVNYVEAMNNKIVAIDYLENKSISPGSKLQKYCNLGGIIAYKYHNILEVILK